MQGPEFEYILRESRRARAIRLKVTPERGLEVIVPAGCNRIRIGPLLDGKRDWIRSALHWAQARRPAPWRPPERIALPAIGRAWNVVTQAAAGSAVAVREVAGEALALSGDIACGPACRAALQGWLRAQAQRALPPWLQALGRGIGSRPPARVSIRRQRTRWGSCSPRRAICLNACLLFLEPGAVGYVLIHELCHLEAMNHGRGFWALVARHCPDYRNFRAVLRQSWRAVPDWA